MAKTDELTKKIEELTAQVQRTEGVEASAAALISGFTAAVKTAVEAALVADNADDQARIDAVLAAVDGVSTRFAASSDLLGAAVAANSGV